MGLDESVRGVSQLDAGVSLDPLEVGGYPGEHGGVALCAAGRRPEGDDADLLELAAVVLDHQGAARVTLKPQRILGTILHLSCPLATVGRQENNTMARRVAYVPVYRRLRTTTVPLRLSQSPKAE